MKTKDILTEISCGATLCMGFEPEGKVYWLEPKRTIIRSDQAQEIIPLLKAGGDRLFDDFASQTWKMK